ncbi:ATP-binding protein [Nocardiopsis ansamitocini]|uniref:ATP-binding protein n=1 Tax=Nocardiopsis ansamitocini TaxID=1670832 RepID=UPI0025576FB7|nr:ATP-binding protein [Nocardiopsis ansamitocini]
MSFEPAAFNAEAVLASVADAVVVLDDKMRVVQWNPGAQRMFGWTLADVLGRQAPIVPDERMAEYHAVLERVRLGTPMSLTTVRVTRSGEHLDVRSSYNRLNGDDGRMAGWVCVLHQHTVTASEIELEQLHMTERAQLVRRLTDVMGDINADLHVDDILDRIVHCLTELTGADAGGFALIQGNSLRLVSITGLSAHLRGFEASLRASLFGELLASGKTVLLATDDTRTLSDLIWSDLEGLHTIALGVSNVQSRPYGALYALYSRRKVGHIELELLELMAAHAGVALGNAMAYQEMVRQRAHEQAIVDASADGISVLDHSGRVRKWNRAAAELTGYAFTDVVGRPPPFPLPVVRGQLVKHRMESGRWLEILLADITGSEERVVDFRDITPAKALEEQKDLFLATAGHELRTPLTVVQGLSTTLDRHWDQMDDLQRHEHVGTIADRAQTMTRLVNNLLLGSQAGTGSLVVRNGVFDVREPLRRAMTAFASLSDKHELCLELPEELPDVYGDPAASDMVISQLLENAFKYSPDGGRVTVSAAEEDGLVAVTVRDEGVGIEPADTERIFERFVQLDVGDRRRFGGIGLGLYIVRRLAREQRGDVTAHADDPGGTRMRFTLQSVN